MCSGIDRQFHYRQFDFNGEKYTYLNRWHNLAWANERSVEIPICFGAFNDIRSSSIISYKGELTGKIYHKPILEIGNVLKNYYPYFTHEVIDRDELGTDLYTHKFTKKYDLIVSISTIEHMEDPVKAIEIIRGLLNEGGKAIITMPMGFRLVHLYSLYCRFSEVYYMERQSWRNEWMQGQRQWIPYGYKYPAANAIMIGVIKK